MSKYNAFKSFCCIIILMCHGTSVSMKKLEETAITSNSPHYVEHVKSKKLGAEEDIIGAVTRLTKEAVLDDNKLRQLVDLLCSDSVDPKFATIAHIIFSSCFNPTLDHEDYMKKISMLDDIRFNRVVGHVVKAQDFLQKYDSGMYGFVSGPDESPEDYM